MIFLHSQFKITPHFYNKAQQTKELVEPYKDLIKLSRLYNQLIFMKSSIKGLLAVAAVLLISVFVSQQTQEMPTVTQRLLQATTYTTTSTRSQNVNDLCPANLDRSTLVNSGDVSSAASMRAEVNSAIGIDGNNLIGLAVNGSTSAAIEIVTAKATNYGMYVGSFMVGFVIFFIIWPFLCCCCCCPGCCPSKCCQKPEDEQYSKCELYWPTVTLIMALTLTMGASIYGYTKVTSFGPSISNVGCSVSIFVDDLLNGNVSTSGQSFFTGLNTLSAQLSYLDSQLGTINTAIDDLTDTNPASSDTLTAFNNVDAARTLVQQIPNPAGPLYQLTLQYLSAIDQSAGTTAIDPLFKPILGDYSQTSTLVGGLYTVIDGIRTFISDTRSSGSTFSTSFGSVNTEIPNIQDNINTIVDSLDKVDKNLNSPLKLFKTAGSNGNMGLQAFYGVLIGFSFFALLGTLLTVCCDKYKCRYLMYFSCIFLFIAGLLSFLLSSFFSMFIPPITWGCSFLDVALSSKSGFTANLGTPLGSNVADMLSPCMSFGDGIIINSLVSGPAQGALNNLTSLINTFGSFNATTQKSYLTGNITPIMNTIRTWCRGQVVDVSGSNFDILQNIANPSYSSWTGCTGFSTDSWVPSNSQNSSYSRISCQVSSSNVGDSSTCTDVLGNNGVNTCGGCMDTAALLRHITATSSITTAINSKYTGTCSNFRTALSNIWTNYYSRKQAAYGPTATAPSSAGSTTVLGRAEYANTMITGTGTSSVASALDTMGTTFSSIVTSLSAISDLTDPKYGLIAGLNCKVFGEDFTRISNIMCGSMYYNMYIMRYALGLSAYGVLFAMCCIVCTGVRHYKHGERKNKVGDAFFKNQDKSSSGNLLRGKE